MNNPINGMRMSVTPSYLKILYDLITELPYWEMKPANEAVSPNEVIFDGVPYPTNFCLAKTGEVYLIFSLNGGQIKLYLSEDPKYDKYNKYSVTQVDPRSGEKTELGIFKGGECIINIIGKEQVLLIVK